MLRSIFFISPLSSTPGVRPGIGQAAKAIGEIGAILEGFEVGFGIGIIVADVGSGMALDHP